MLKLFFPLSLRGIVQKEIENTYCPLNTLCYLSTPDCLDVSCGAWRCHPDTDMCFYLCSGRKQ